MYAAITMNNRFSAPHKNDKSIPPSKKMSMRDLVNAVAWNERLSELIIYKRIHGHCNVPQKYKENPSLGFWVNKQRIEHKLREDGKKSAMTDEKVEALEEIGFVWAKRRGDNLWMTRFEQLREYYCEHGNCLVPTKYTKNPPLGRWVSTQRWQYKLFQKGKTSSMTKERIDKLNSICFKWRLI